MGVWHVHVVKGPESYRLHMGTVQGTRLPTCVSLCSLTLKYLLSRYPLIQFLAQVPVAPVPWG